MEDDAKSALMQSISLVRGRPCGPAVHQAREIFYRNNHPSRKIRIYIRHHYIYNNEQVVVPQEYVLEPNPGRDPNEVTELDVRMGCPIPGPTSQQFHWDLTGADWA